ncbi:MAG: hypothetical protein OXD33_08200 [Rhodobacteraceae bacterium]|nr:hypothetical protein [Paracoccaceae bacterium]
MRNWCIVCVLAVLWGHAAIAQTTRHYELQSNNAERIAILDFNAAYNGSEFGRRIQSEYTLANQQLVRQNRYFDCLLEKEERLIADAKPSLDDQSFARRRDAFTDKADQRRRIQDTKVALVGEWAESEVARFRESIAHVSGEVARDRDLDAIILDNEVVWYDRRFELSWLFVQLLNRDFGDGTGDGYISAADYSRLAADIADEADPDCAAELNPS